MRYAQALLLSSQIQAQTVSDYDVTWVSGSVVDLLGRHSPTVEPVWFDEGAFWCPVSGLKRLYGSFEQWAEVVRAAIQELGFRAAIAIGESCISTYISARETGPGTSVSATGEIGDNRLEALPLPARDLTNLCLLGITTIGSFAQLSEDELRSRVSKHTLSLYRFITSPRLVPLQGVGETESFERYVLPDPPLSNIQQVLDAVAELLRELITTVRSSGMWITAVSLTIRDEGGTERVEHVRTARATRDSEMLLRLSSLRLHRSGEISERIEYCGVQLETVHAVNQQQELIQDARTREFPLDEKRVRRAIAVLQARLGNEAVQTVEVRDDHLPEQQFRTVPVMGFAYVVHVRRFAKEPAVRNPSVRVRRIHQQSVRDIVIGKRLHAGPFFVSTGWWDGAVTERIYAYFRERNGRLSWAYRPRGDPSWWEQGYVD